jgi:hypothetical protein
MPSFEESTISAAAAFQKISSRCADVEKIDGYPIRYLTSFEELEHSGEMFIVTSTPVLYRPHRKDDNEFEIANQIWIGQLDLWDHWKPKFSVLAKAPPNAKYLIWFQHAQETDLNLAIERNELQFGKVAFVTREEFEKFLHSPAGRNLIFMKDHILPQDKVPAWN